MSDYKESGYFKCAFNERAMRANAIEGLLVMFVYFLLIGRALRNVWISLGFLAFYLLLVWWVIYTDKSILTKSYFELSEDGMLKCWSRGKVRRTYPIKEIKSIERTNVAGKKKSNFSYPILYQTRGRDIIPGDGVMIFFNRKWYKSVIPVFFNPEDIDGFISAVNNRLGDNILEDSSINIEK